jgi:hypothetical protein
MKSLAVSALTAAVLIGVFSVGSRGQVALGQSADSPWQVGHCYRVFPSEGNTLQLVEVLEPPRGNWVRVRSLPSSENIISPQAPLWVNVTSPFAVQEWKCKG